MLSASALPADAVAEALRAACRLDMSALKPGNVGLHGGGHGMEAAQFLASADVAAPLVCRPGARVGVRILGGVEATQAAAGCNTNLGILLLAAPLAAAFEQAREGDTLRGELARVLAQLDVQDARLAYRAIRLACPGGLGESERHDVRDEPVVTLLEAMAQAAQRDSIARQYVQGYADIFDHALPHFTELLQRWGDENWAATGVFLDFLARMPDTHVARKHGLAAAEALQRKAALWSGALSATAAPQQLSPRLTEWDRELKARGLNPGTSADLMVATVFAARLQALLEARLCARDPEQGARASSMCEQLRTLSIQPR